MTLLGAAIATGNAIIMVPSQKNPLPALTFIQVSLRMLKWFREEMEGTGTPDLFKVSHCRCDPDL